MKGFFICLFLFVVVTSCGSNTVNERTGDRIVVGDKPPKAWVEIEDEKYETVLGTYCWNTGCVDTIGPVEMLEGKAPISVKPGDGIEFVMDYEPKPNQFSLTQYNGDERTEVKLKSNRFSAPMQEGVYYYVYGVWWMDEKKEHVSHGDAFYNFVIEVS